MSITKGAMLISNANAVGSELVNKLGGTGYKPVEWADAINLLGISNDDKASALASITEGTYTGDERGSIKYNNCNAVGSMLNKKFSTDRGFKPVEWESAISKLTPLAERTVSGSIANITDGADRVPIKSWEVEISPTLSGKSAIECTQTGKNLISANDESKTFSANVMTNYDVASLELKKGVTYTFSAYQNTAITGSTRNTLRITFDGIYTYESSGTNFHNQAGVHSMSITPSQDGIAVFAIWTHTPNEDVTYSQFMVEIGSPVSTFEPYTAPTQYTAQLGRTIYGGTVDVVKGEGESSYKIITVGNSGWNYYSAGGYIYRDFSDKVIPEIGDSDHVLVTDNPDMPYGGVNYASQFQDLHIYQAHNPAIYIKDTSCTSLNDFYTKYYNMKIGYELATPTDFTFTPITPTPETALGTNNFWADEGDSEVTYRKDPDIPDTPVQVINMNNNENNDN